MSDPQTVTLSQIESHLWESANILRGPVDAADFKTYIFPLLFFKRICDVWDEEYDEIVADTGDTELALFPESHRFQIPDDCHWNDVRAVATNVGNALQRAMREIEKANPDTLYGVFGDAQWTNKDRLPDELLKRKLDGFGRELSSGASTLSKERVDRFEENYLELKTTFGPALGRDARQRLLKDITAARRALARAIEQSR